MPCPKCFGTLPGEVAQYTGQMNCYCAGTKQPQERIVFIETSQYDRPTLQDRFFVVILAGLMSRYSQTGYSDESAITKAWHLSALALAERNGRK